MNSSSVTHSDSSALQDIEHISDTQSLRRIMHAVLYRLGDTPWEDLEQSHLTEVERNIVDRLITQAQNVPLLHEMVHRFATARLGDDNTIKKAANDLLSLAIEAVQQPERRPIHEHHLAESIFLRRIDQEGFNYSPAPEHTACPGESDIPGGQGNLTGENASSGMSSTKRGRGLDSESEQSMAIPAKRAKKTPAPPQLNNTPQEARPFDLVSNPLSAISVGSMGDIRPTRKKGAPGRRTGDRPVNDGTIDRNNAQLGVEDRTKFIIEIPCEREENGRLVTVAPIRYVFHHVEGFNFNNKKHLHRLNGWRSQVFTRCFGSRKDVARGSWTMSELERILGLLGEHLNSESVRGSRGLVNWAEVALRFNEGVAHRIIPAGEMTVETQYTLKTDQNIDENTIPMGQDGATDNVTADGDTRDKEGSGGPELQGSKIIISKSRPIGKDRAAFPRTASGIRSQIQKFTDPRMVKLISDAKVMGRTGLTAVSVPQEKGNATESNRKSMANNGEAESDVPSAAGAPSQPSEIVTPATGNGISGSSQGLVADKKARTDSVDAEISRDDRKKHDEEEVAENVETDRPGGPQVPKSD